MLIERRNFLTGVAAALSAPAIIRIDMLMPVKRWSPPLRWVGDSLLCNGAELRAGEFPDLFAVMGHTYGGFGDRFNIPPFVEVSYTLPGLQQLVYCMTQQGQIWMSPGDRTR